MRTLKLKTTLAAASIALSLLTPAAQAQAAKASAHAPTVGHAIAAQGNAALQLIRAEMVAAVKLAKPQLPARAHLPRATRVATPVAGRAPDSAAFAK